MIPADKRITYNHQAGDIDYYKQTEFDRGHLFPSLYKSDEVDKRSTFTLTNAVPQRRQFNNGRWNMMERCVKCILDNYCINNNDKKEGFVVIGAQPSNEIPLNQRINIPSVLWSAFCCYSHSQNTWLASAHWGENKDDGPNLQTKTLGELNTELGIEAFPGTQCPNDTSITQLYSEPKSLCHSKCRQSWNRKKSTSTPPTTTALQIQHLCLLHPTHRSLPATHLSHHLEHLPHFSPQFQITVPHLVSKQLALWVLQPVSTAATVQISSTFFKKFRVNESDEIPHKASVLENIRSIIVKWKSIISFSQVYWSFHADVFSYQSLSKHCSLTDTYHRPHHNLNIVDAS
ncbi:uncharacterized protein LOC134624495 [Pelmatolapia mariae]|uniref:uncharacterized protein LOC134624495 n=1 Tax=Pelmatolapia mariae TaxID=158779 RepID=UPI002FE5C833